jgi:hypothetical protein
LDEESLCSVVIRFVKFSFAALLAGGSWSTESWQNPSLENDVSEQAGKSVVELAIVCAQLPKSRCHASLCITPSFDKYSRDENTLCGI